ncbi:MAG TPA: twin-arginine translocase TatA/TatE family subunit [Thermoanaerobaculia bacterium]|nr:twin-arginine translocase TatA/TatE family subunit [Thermoanaerobaculia bacterium]
MFGLGVPELLFILVLALLIFGPKRLPEIGRTLGRGMSEFRKASNELKRTINVELALDEQPEPPVRPYRPSPALDALRAPRFPDGSPAPVAPGAPAVLAETLTPDAPVAPEGAASPAEPDDKPDELT